MIKDFILGNKSLQKLWWTLYKICLKGLNYDRGHVPSVNGEAYAIKYAMKRLPKKDKRVIFDIGANRGQYLHMLLSELGAQYDYAIYCFEPQHDAYRSLLDAAGRHKNIITENTGLGSATEKKTLYKDSPQSELGSLYPSDYSQHHVQLSLPETVEIDTIDAYCVAHNIHTIDFLKIDAEGHELEVLKGAANLISNNRIYYIQFEFGLPAIESRIFLKDFVKLLDKYDIYRILPNGLELITYSEYHELFLTTNYLSILKNPIK
jgi:FkbM family methyltransferase